MIPCVVIYRSNNENSREILCNYMMLTTLHICSHEKYRKRYFYEAMESSEAINDVM